MHIIVDMRRLLAAAMMIIAILPLSAERVMWYTPSNPDFTTETGTFFSSGAFEGLSDTIPLGSSVALTSENGETVVTITGKLPELPPGRTFAITEAAAEELGIGTTGVGDADVTILREGTIKESEGNTGWYTYKAGSYSNGKDAYDAYTRLIANGLKPYAEAGEGTIDLSVKHIVAFRRAEAEKLIADSGIENAEAVMESNPYT